MSFIIDEGHEEIYADVRAILAEHFPNFCFIVMDDMGDFYYDYTNAPIGKMLIHEMKEDMEGNPLDDDWIWDFDADDVADNDSLWDD